MPVFRIDVQYSTHDAVKAGVIAIGMDQVDVLADDADTAACIAAQMIASCHGAMPTATFFVV